MKGFSGFPDGKLRLTAVPNRFFSDLLPIIDNLAELKVTLYAFWALTQKEGKVRYMRLTDFLNDPEFIKGMGPTNELASEALLDGVERAVARGTFLHVKIESADGKMDLYFLNTEKGRAAVDGITRGEWRPNPDDEEPITLLVERPKYLRPVRTKYRRTHPLGRRRTAGCRTDVSRALDRRSDSACRRK
jgi:DNA replication protein